MLTCQRWRVNKYNINRNIYVKWSLRTQYVNELGHVYQTMTGSLGNFSGGLFSKKKITLNSPSRALGNPFFWTLYARKAEKEHKFPCITFHKEILLKFNFLIRTNFTKQEPIKKNGLTTNCACDAWNEKMQLRLFSN